MTICPFMSGPVLIPAAPNTLGPVIVDHFIGCQREECAALGLVGRSFGYRLIGGEVPQETT